MAMWDVVAVDTMGGIKCQELQTALNDWIMRHSGWKKRKCGKKQL